MDGDDLGLGSIQGNESEIANPNQNQTESSNNVSGDNQEVTSENTNKGLYKGIPENQISDRDMCKYISLERKYNSYKELEVSDHKTLKLYNEKIKESEDYVNGTYLKDEKRNFRLKLLVEDIQDNERTMQVLVKKIEEIRLKISPTDVGQPLKKRKFED